MPPIAIRVASFNVEWMNDWFTSDAIDPAAFHLPHFTDQNGAQHDTDRTATKVARVIHTINPDILAIQEGPSRPQELQLFIDTYLKVLGSPLDAFLLGDTGGSQRIGILYNSSKATVQLIPHAEIKQLIDPWEVDIDGDGFVDLYRFARTPLVARATVAGREIDLIAMHTKSNFINRGRDMWNDPAQRQNYIVASITNRRRIAAEAAHVHSYVESRLATDLSARIIILGDLNDGPGRDYFEERYLSQSVTDILIGSGFEPDRLFTHAQHDVPSGTRYTARFDDFVGDGKTPQNDKSLLLDHILLSPGFDHGNRPRRVKGSGKIRHDIYDANVTNQGARRDERPSDHRPVTVRIEV